MLTPDEFRRLALALPGVTEQQHMGHPDFRAGGRIFATLGYPDRMSAMVKLTPELQAVMIREHPAAFAPAPGAWGRQGSTMVNLAQVDEELVGEALTEARRHATSRTKKKR
jgi:hypothetical protein